MPCHVPSNSYSRRPTMSVLPSLEIARLSRGRNTTQNSPPALIGTLSTLDPETCLSRLLTTNDDLLAETEDIETPLSTSASFIEIMSLGGDKRHAEPRAEVDVILFPAPGAAVVKASHSLLCSGLGSITHRQPCKIFHGKHAGVDARVIERLIRISPVLHATHEGSRHHRIGHSFRRMNKRTMKSRDGLLQPTSLGHRQCFES